MTPDQARELFSAAFEGELDESTVAELRAALAAHPELQREYAAFEATLALVRKRPEGAPPAPDLLSGVQERLRQRSRGRFYADRFARRRGLGLAWPLVLGAAMLGVLAFLWYCLDLLQRAQVAP